MDAIWFKKELSIAELTALCDQTIAELLDLKFIETGSNYIKATMPVDHRTHQPYGLLHGGASCVLAETLGSIASGHVIDPENLFVLVLRSMPIISVQFAVGW
jgi:1,4-dihydroxy-2-naphthoyl-CoA hydrolase